jgi:hypothetical protein
VATKKSDHIHKFKRLRYKSGNEIFFCTLPDCNVKLNPALALGKRCLCWRCGESFILSEYSLRLAKPHCDACHKPKKIENVISNEISPMFNSYEPPLTLAERLQQTIKQAQPEEDEI